MPTGGRSLAVIGAGWAGLATAVQAVQAGHAVTVFEMALHAGGRARTVAHHDLVLDNGQHILIGAYRETLALLRTVGVDPNQSLRRQPLTLVDPSGRGLRLDVGAAARLRQGGVAGLALALACAAGLAVDSRQMATRRISRCPEPIRGRSDPRTACAGAP